MTTTTRIILGFFAFAFTSIAATQEAKVTPKNERYYGTMRDSAGIRLYYRSAEKPLPDLNKPFDTLKVSRNWSKVKKGLSESQVIELLGRSHVMEQDPTNALIYWWYGRRAVVFNSVTRKVSYCDK